MKRQKTAAGTQASVSSFFRTAAAPVSPGGLRSSPRNRVGGPSNPSPVSAIVIASDAESSDDEQGNEPNEQGTGTSTGAKPWSTSYEKDRKYKAAWFLKYKSLQRYDIDNKESAICSACSHKLRDLVQLGNKLDTINKHMKSTKHTEAAAKYGSKGDFRPQPINALPSICPELPNLQHGSC